VIAEKLWREKNTDTTGFRQMLHLQQTDLLLFQTDSVAELTVK